VRSNIQVSIRMKSKFRLDTYQSVAALVLRRDKLAIVYRESSALQC